MRRHRSNFLFMIAATSLLFGPPVATARAGSDAYTIDILSNDRYPQLQDSWMMRINNKGVAAGYIATESVIGPYLPTTYADGQFHPLGNQSVGYGNFFGIVTGIDDQGDVVGSVTNADGTTSQYVERGGVVQNLVFPAGATNATVLGIGAGGIAYGNYVDQNGLSQVFTAAGAVANMLAPILGLPNLSTDVHWLSSAGVLGVYASSLDYSISPAVLYNLATSATTILAVPAGFAYADISVVSTTGVYGAVDNADFSVHDLASWNLDGSFRGFIGLPSNVVAGAVHFNDDGQAIALGTDGLLMYYDGTSWSAQTIAGLGSYSLASIADFNDQGQFVGLVLNNNGFEWGYVASPVPEPSSTILMGIGLAAARAARRSRRDASRDASREA